MQRMARHVQPSPLNGKMLSVIACARAMDIVGHVEELLEEPSGGARGLVRAEGLG